MKELTRATECEIVRPPGLVSLLRRNKPACCGNRSTTPWSSNPSLLIYCLAFSSPGHIMIWTQVAVHFVSFVLLFLSRDILLIIFVSQIFVLQPAASILIKSLVATARSQSQTLWMKLLRSNFRSGHISRSFLSPLFFFVLLQMDDSVTSRLNSTIDYVVICCTSCRLPLSLSG